MYKAFSKYMDKNWDLKYLQVRRDFVNATNGDIFGYVHQGTFYFTTFAIDIELEDWFGPTTHTMLLDYLRERFPDMDIDDIQ